MYMQAEQKANDMWQDPNIIEDPLLMPAAAWPPNHEFLEDRLLWDYVSKMYVQWFRGEGEDFPEAEQELRDAYGMSVLQIQSK
jgi:kinetochore protein NDC80